MSCPFSGGIPHASSSSSSASTSTPPTTAGDSTSEGWKQSGKQDSLGSGKPRLIRGNTLGSFIPSSEDLNLSTLSAAIVALLLPQVRFTNCYKIFIYIK